ncbi:putative protein N(5)-glutamine methyltransferase [uncultured Jatrophihabitans sp.]|uniref:putative protein N(5)-glutamine methyltransferase n=1 Tax=uncultured Jatrophihabitans sp. TaxID=1610747 RepID=UPI0035CBEE5D
MTDSFDARPDVIGTLRAAGCVFAEAEADLLTEAASTPLQLAALVRRRTAGEPLEHILGWAEFAALRISVAPGVFVPRRRTEFLVRTAARLAPPQPVALDLCCGAGALAAAFAAAAPIAELHAADIDPVAAECARRNLASVGGRVYLGDLFAPLPSALRGRVDVLLANVPYVPTSAIALLPPEAREHERRAALDGGADGLDMVRRVAAETAAWLAPGGALFVEVSDAQADAAIAIAQHAGLAARVVTAEDADDCTGVLVAQTRPSTAR